MNFRIPHESKSKKYFFAQKKKSDCCEKWCSGMICGSGQASVKIKLGTSCPIWPPPTPKFELQASATRRRLPWIWKVSPVTLLSWFLASTFYTSGLWHSWIGFTWAAIRLVFPMVELSMEVIEGLLEPLIGLRCWISRCTWPTPKAS